MFVVLGKISRRKNFAPDNTDQMLEQLFAGEDLMCAVASNRKSFDLQNKKPIIRE